MRWEGGGAAREGQGEVRTGEGGDGAVSEGSAHQGDATELLSASNISGGLLRKACLHSGGM